MSTINRSRGEEITAVLRDEILRGQYRAGERLPSERDLAVRFEANRGAVREALKKLEQMGIADITPGGVRVVPVEEATLDVLGHVMDMQELPDPLLVRQVFEVLGALISMSARTAVEAADDEQIDAMHRIVKDMIAGNADSERNQQNWKELATLFAGVNKNLVLRLILNGLKTQFMGRMTQTGLTVELDREKNSRILKQMDMGLAARDPKCVAEAISSHFEMLQETVGNALVSAADSSRSASNG